MQQLCEFSNLHQAWQSAKKGKNQRPNVALFGIHAEPLLLALQQRLLEGSWRPSKYREFTIYDRKPRTICAAPFADRVVHHALMQRTSEALEPAFHPHCYACRPNKGVHKAVRQYQRWARRYPYVLQLDVRQYFSSINQHILMEKLCKLVKGEGLQQLMGHIIGSTPKHLGRQFLLPHEDLVSYGEQSLGLPIGNLTSQHWANLYLSELDYVVNDTLGCSAYLRYVDDMTLLGDSKEQLWHWRDQISHQLADIGLQLHPSKQTITPTRLGIGLLGYRVFPDYVKLRKDAGFRYQRKLRRLAHDYSLGFVDVSDIKQSIAAWVGHGKMTRQNNLQTKVIMGVKFNRGCESKCEPAGVARRLLEQQTEQPTFG